MDINDELMRQAKQHAADRGVTLREVIETALRALLQHATPAGGYTLQWRTERGRLMPGVELDNRDRLFDLMEGRE